MSIPDDKRPEPWHRHFWPWFLIALPATAVAASLVTIYLATSRPHAMVVDDYARIGLTIQRNQERDRLATELGLHAQLVFDVGTEQVDIELSGDLPPAVGPLILTLSHPTRVERDLRTELTGADGHYRGLLALPVNDRWYVQVEPTDGSWRLAGELQHGQRTLRLEAADAP